MEKKVEEMTEEAIEKMKRSTNSPVSVQRKRWNVLSSSKTQWARLTKTSAVKQK